MEEKYSGQERRRHKRLNVHFMISYQVDKPLDVHISVENKEINAFMSDLSEGGTAIITEYDIPLDTPLSINFTLINMYYEKGDRIRSIRTRGKVRNNMVSQGNKHRLGIEFTAISEEDKRAIAEFVKMALG